MLINEWDKFIHELSDDSTNRLRALQKLGKGLGVYFIIADQAEKFDLLQHTEGITMTAIKGDVILLGGSAKNHLACMHRIDQKVQNETLDTYQGYLCMDDNYIALQFMVE